MVNAQQLKPGLRALIIGSEHVALSCVLTLRRAGTKIAGMVEQDPELHTYALAAKALSIIFRFPIYTHTVVEDILGNERVEGVNLITDGTGKSFFLDCDTVIITGKFRPVTLLIDQTAIEQDPLSGGPVVDTNLMTSVERIFAAGNILRGADMNDLCALEGTRAARRILEMAESTLPEKGRPITLGAEPPIRYVVPQCILPDGRSSATWPWFSPGVSIQLARTLRNPVVEAWSGSEKIWEGSYSKINANTRTVLPLKKFKWNRVDPGQKIVLKIRRADNQPF